MLPIRTFGIATLILAISGSGLALADEFLSATELKKLYSDVRVDSVTRRGSPTVFKFRPDGTYSLKTETPRRVIESEGKWWVEEPNKFCRTTPRSDQFCIRHKKTATGYDRYRADEDRKLRSVWNISKGTNPLQAADTNKLPKSQIWKKGWAVGATYCHEYDPPRDPSRNHCRHVQTVSDNLVEIGRSRGSIANSTSAPILRNTTFVLDTLTGIFGETGNRGLKYAPYEIRGCLPVRPGHNCLEGLNKPIEATVEARNFPNWNSIEIIEAKYSDAWESYRFKETGNTIQVIRFTMRARRNDGGTYTRSFLYREGDHYPLVHATDYEGANLSNWSRITVAIRAPNTPTR